MRVLLVSLRHCRIVVRHLGTELFLGLEQNMTHLPIAIASTGPGLLITACQEVVVRLRY